MRFFKPLFACLLALAFLSPLAALAEDDFTISEWHIKDFRADIQINEDSSINVTETIKGDFQGQWHGIYRWIPVKYLDRFGNQLHLRMKVLSVTDENGQNYDYDISNNGRNRKLKIYLRDPLNEERTAVIKYQVQRAINYFGEYDELYWNVTGNEWDVPIDSAETTITIPKADENLKATCFSGYLGSADQECSMIKEENRVEIKAFNKLSVGEGLTAVVGFSKGLVRPPSSLQKVVWFTVDNWWLLIPLVVLIFLFVYWRKHGKEYNKGPIIPRYDLPRKMNVLEMGTLIDEKLNPRDLSALIIDLARRGYLQIEETNKTTALIKRKEADSEMDETEQFFFRKLFGSKDRITLGDLRYDFYRYVDDIKKKVFASLVQKKYFARNPQDIKATFYVIGGAIMFLTLAGLGFLVALGAAWAIPSLALSGALFLLFAPFMSRKTRSGQKMLAHVQGLEEYISRAEKDRLKDASPQAFELFLPLAVALGLQDHWARAFKDIYDRVPDWYKSDSITTFNAVSFADHLHISSSSLSSALTAAPRATSSSGGSSGFSSGGGFSGGGFGGGGGSGF